MAQENKKNYYDFHVNSLNKNYVLGPNIGGWGSNWPSVSTLTFGVSGSVNTNADNWSVDPNTLRIGGHRLDDNGYLNVHGMSYNTGEKGGCILSVVMDTLPDIGQDCGAGAHDSVAQWVQTSNAPPMYRVGPEITDENGHTHTLSFSADGVTVSPMLPASWRAVFTNRGLNAVTNIVAGNPLPAANGFVPKGSPFLHGVDPQFYDGVITSYVDNPSTNTTKLYVANGWHTMANSQDKDQSITPGSLSTDKLDTVIYSRYKQANLFIGTPGKIFLGNQQCVVSQDPTSTDGSSLARLDSPVTACTVQEYDLINNSPDYQTTFQGPSIGLSGHLPSASSYGFMAGGNLPEGFRAWLGEDGYDFDGDAFVTGSYRGVAGTRGAQKTMFQSLQQEEATWNYASTQQKFTVWQQTDSLGYGRTDGHHNFQDNSIWIGDLYGGDKFLPNGIPLSAIVINPVWSKWGISLCGSNGATAGNTSGDHCVTVDTNGNLLSGSIKADHGAFNSIDSNNKYNSISVNSQVNFHSSVVIPFKTPKSSNSNCEKGQIEMDENYIYSCVSKNTWHRTRNGSAW